MSSPITITDSDDSLNESNKIDVIQISDDEEEPMKISRLDQETPVKVKQERPESEIAIDSPVKLKISPTTKLSIDVDRLKWLSHKIRLSPISARRLFKTESPPQSPDFESRKNENFENDEYLPSVLCEESNTGVNTEEKCNMKGKWMYATHVKKEAARCSDVIDANKEKGLATLYEEIKPSCTSSYFEGSKEQQGLFGAVKAKFPCSPLDKLKDERGKARNANKEKRLKLEESSCSPRKPGAFGSTKEVTQTLLTTDSFLPKKAMTEHPVKMPEIAPHVPPMHAERWTKGHGSSHSSLYTFTESQLHFLEAIRGEGLIKKYLETVLSYVTVYRKAPPVLVFSLLSDTLLKSKSQYLSSKCFWTLKRIQELHPSCPSEVGHSIDWDFVTSIVEQMELSGFTRKYSKQHKYDSISCLSVFNATMAMAFVVDVMEEEVHRKQFSLRRTIAFRLLSVMRAPRNFACVVSWVTTCITHQVSSKSAKYGSLPSDSGMPGASIPFPNQPLSPLTLLQRVIKLSLSVSENPESCADRMATELLIAYSHLATLDGRSLLLQILPSHLLKGKLVALILQVSCEDPDNTSAQVTGGGIPEIVYSQFERMPPRRNDEVFSGMRGCEGCLNSSEEAEEFSMLLAYSLQSYMFCHHKKLQGPSRRMRCTIDELEELEVEESEEERHLSLSDVDTLCNMGDNVMLLKARLMSLCPNLSNRTQQLIGFLLDRRLWDCR